MHQNNVTDVTLVSLLLTLNMLLSISIDDSEQANTGLEYHTLHK